MSCKDYLIQLTVNNANLTAKEKGELISHFEKIYSGKCEEEAKTEKRGFLKFTYKERLQMPQPVRESIRNNGCVAHIVKRSGKYEITYNRDGYYIHVTDCNLAEAKAKFICEAKNA